MAVVLVKLNNVCTSYGRSVFQFGRGYFKKAVTTVTSVTKTWHKTGNTEFVLENWFWDVSRMSVKLAYHFTL